MAWVPHSLRYPDAYLTFTPLWKPWAQNRERHFDPRCIYSAERVLNVMCEKVTRRKGNGLYGVWLTVQGFSPVWFLPYTLVAILGWIINHRHYLLIYFHYFSLSMWNKVYQTISMLCHNGNKFSKKDINKSRATLDFRHLRYALASISNRRCPRVVSVKIRRSKTTCNTTGLTSC